MFKYVDEFENKVAKYAGSNYAVATDSCTHAIFISLLWEIQNEKLNTVCCPSQTYVSIPQTLRHLGLDIMYIDEKWTGFYKLHNSSVVDSACLFTSNMYESKTKWCVSFHHRKTLSTIRGGMILNDDYEFTQWAKKMVHDGRDRNLMMKDDDPILCGYHYYMTPETAILGLENLKKINDNNSATASWENYKRVTHI